MNLAPSEDQQAIPATAHEVLSKELPISRLRELAADRNAALRIFVASRNTTTPIAQREFWLEFSWIDQEYRAEVRKLAQFCRQHGALAVPKWTPPQPLAQ